MATCPNCHQPITEADKTCRFCSFIVMTAALPAPADSVRAPSPSSPLPSVTEEPATPPSQVMAAKGKRTKTLAVAAVAVIGTLAMLMSQRAPTSPGEPTIRHAAEDPVVTSKMQTVVVPTIPAAPPEYTSAATPAVEPKWTTGRERVGRSNVKFELMAEQDVPVWKKRVRPILTVRCLGNKTEVFVMTFSPASIEQNGSKHSVAVGFDGGPEVTQEWEHADDHSALFAEDGVSVARRIAAASTMTFEFTPFNAEPVTAEFNVSGFETHLKSVARTCSWK